MRKRTRKELRSLDRRRKRDSRRPRSATPAGARYDLASLFRGLYHRVARRLGVDPSYVSRVARRERRSKIIEEELRRELSKILKNIGQGSGRVARMAGRKKVPEEAAKKAARKGK
jgi:hypothetical protein